jgi:outer membrane protein insertion porin family
MFKGALFTDVGNIWTINEDPNRIGGKFTSDWYRQIAVAGGFGLRVDLDFLILRFDIGIPWRNPALPDGAKWIFQSRAAYIQEGIDVFGEEDYARLLPKQFQPVLQIGIGFPF